MTELKDEKYSDIDNLYDQLLKLDLTLNKCTECHNQDQELIKELKAICEERAMIMNAQQISITNMDSIIDQLHSQYEKSLNEGVEKNILLNKLTILQEENIKIGEKVNKEKKELEENYSKKIIKYEIKIEELIKQNQSKENERIIYYDEIIKVKDKEIEKLKQDIEQNHQQMMTEMIRMKDDFERKGEEYKSQLQLLNSFSSNMSNDFYRKKYEFLKIDLEKKIGELTNQLNVFITNDNHGKRFDNGSFDDVAYNQNVSHNQIGKNNSKFITASSLLEPKSPYQPFNCPIEKISKISQNMKIKSIQNSPLYNNKYNSTPEQMIFTKNNKKIVPQKRKLFSINSINCLE